MGQIKTATIDEARRERARRIVMAFGGASRVGEITGRTRHTVTRWWWTLDQSGGTNGYIPADAQEALLRYARKFSIEITEADFFEPPELSRSIVVKALPPKRERRDVQATAV